MKVKCPKCETVGHVRGQKGESFDCVCPCGFDDSVYNFTKEVDGS